MSQHMDSLAVGDTIDVRGPYGEFTYLGRGRFTRVRGRALSLVSSMGPFQ